MILFSPLKVLICLQICSVSAIKNIYPCLTLLHFYIPTKTTMKKI